MRDTETVSSLSATCSAVRELVHHSVKAITISKHWRQQPLQLLHSLLAGDWQNLQSLTLRYFVLHKAEIDLLTSRSWPLLDTLDVSHSVLDTEAVITLTQQALSLKHLNLSHTSLDAPALLSIANAGWELESLYLRGISLGTAGLLTVKTLVKGKWPSLRRLVLSNNKLTAPGILPLLKANWVELRHLDLSSNLLTAEAIRVLVQAKLPRLSRLDLSCNLLSQSALQALSCSNWLQLRHLDLGHCNMYTLEGLSGNWPSLSSLCLSGNSVDGETVSSILLQWPMLADLELEDSMLPTAAVQMLVQGHWPRLRKLGVAQNKLDLKAKHMLGAACQQSLHEGLNHLCTTRATRPWPRLRRISV